jgi:hypothetical protein
MSNKTSIRNCHGIAYLITTHNFRAISGHPTKPPKIQDSSPGPPETVHPRSLLIPCLIRPKILRGYCGNRPCDKTLTRLFWHGYSADEPNRYIVWDVPPLPIETHTNISRIGAISATAKSQKSRFTTMMRPKDHESA